MCHGREAGGGSASKDLEAPGPYLHPRDWWSTHLMTQVCALLCSEEGVMRHASC